MSDIVFKFDDVSYTYGDNQPAIRNVTFDVLRGESIAILGANASGKSTLLQLMDGLVFPLSGQIEAFGTPLSEKTIDGTKFGRYFRQNVSFLFQNIDAQLFCPSVADELSFGPSHLGMSEEETARRVSDLANMFHLGSILDRSPYTLSGGEKRRVGLAAVLAVGPQVILLDEPTTSLDPRSQAFLVDTLLELADAGKTLIIATHDLELARDVTTRAIVLTEDHKLAADQSTEDVLSDSDLLADVNLIHIHQHRHGKAVHAHPHTHIEPHQHKHNNP